MAMAKKQTISKLSESSSIGEAKLISLLENMSNARCPATHYASNYVQYDVATMIVPLWLSMSVIITNMANSHCWLLVVPLNRAVVDKKRFMAIKTFRRLTDVSDLQSQ